MKTTGAQALPSHNGNFTWDTLPAIPDSIGFAGSFAGVTDNVLIVAGGSNFPGGGAPWTGATKQWYDKIFVLEKPGAQWKEAGHLPLPLGYGVSVSTKKGLLLIGGSNATAHHANVFMLHYSDGKIKIENLPSLPFPLANSCGAMVDDKILVAGGLSGPSSDTTEKVFLSLDLKAKELKWESLPAWPGPSRMLAVAGVHKNCFFLFSGTELKDGKRKYLIDAYAWSAKEGWQKLADLPLPAVAAPTPAFSAGKSELFVFGGDTGADAAKAAELREMHPGFSNTIMKYEVKKDVWSVAGEIFIKREKDFIENPNNSIWAPVTTSLVNWNNKIIIPGGEVRPATRTPNVLVAERVNDSD